jgi:hypothetical protein
VKSDLLLAAARSSLEKNLELSGDSLYLTAGRNQFRSLWARDFCFAARGLSLAGHKQVVVHQLELLLDHLKEDGTVPRSFDGFSTKLRVVLAPFHSPKLGNRLKPEYFGEHGTRAVDSAPLLILEILATKNPALKNKLAAKLPLLLQQAGKPGELPSRQPPFSDWQDSAKRTGPCFLQNLLWWAAMRALEEDELVSTGVANFIRYSLNGFLQGPLPLSEIGKTQLAFDGALLGLRYQLFSDRKAVWAALREHPTWREKTGVPVSAPYSSNEISWTTKLVGLRHYHDGLSWTWILALALAAAKEFQDQEEFERITAILEKSLDAEGNIPEILDPQNDFQAFQNRLYKAEAPFSWGAGMLLEALLA